MPFSCVKSQKLSIVWFSFAGLLILISIGTSISRGMQINGTLKLWEFFNANWSQSIVPKQAISDYLMNNPYGKYDIDDHIYFLEFITERDSQDIERKFSSLASMSKINKIPMLPKLMRALLILMKL